jgi:hypothetical protein
MTKADKLRKICNEINSEFPVKLDLDNNHMTIYANGYSKIIDVVGKYNLSFITSTVVGPFTVFTVTVWN